MAVLTWDADGNRKYETGVKNGVLWVMGSSGYGNAVAWNGLTGVSESPSGADATKLYADNMKYLNLIAAEDFAFGITAFTYPAEFEACDGCVTPVAATVLGQQNRSKFGFCYRTEVGNDLEGNDYGYKIHFVFGCSASPSSKDYATINDSPDAIEFSWDVETTPVKFTWTDSSSVAHDYESATITIDTSKFPSAKKTTMVSALETWLKGNVYDDTKAMPTPAAILTEMETIAAL